MLDLKEKEEDRKQKVLAVMIFYSELINRKPENKQKGKNIQVSDGK